MKAYIFPGQGAQFPGMGKDLYEKNEIAKNLFHQANAILGFDITAMMFGEDAEALKATRVTQPAIFLHSVILSRVLGDAFQPNIVAGHSLGEFSALVAVNALTFEDGLRLVYQRALAMQDACDEIPGTMAAILGLDDATVESVCSETAGTVVAANYNCPGQLVISGEKESIMAACDALKSAGAKRALPLPVGGAFHSPLMEPAKRSLETAIKSTVFNIPQCPIYQNVTAKAVSDPTHIQEHLIAQLTAPVRWTQSVSQMIEDGATDFIEVGPGKVLQGLVKKINRDVQTASAAL